MRATLRQNGDMMFTLRVEIVIGRVDLERIVIESLHFDGTHIGQVPVSRGAIVDALRKRLRFQGPWGEDSWMDVTVQQSQLASEIVQKAFPELYGEKQE